MALCYRRRRMSSPFPLHRGCLVVWLPVWIVIVVLSISAESSQAVSMKDDNRRRRRPSVENQLSESEKIFLSQPNPWSARNNLAFLTSQPHVAGTKGDYVMADFVEREFNRAGIPIVSTFDLDVYLNYPRTKSIVELRTIESAHNASNLVIFQASLSEDILEFDPTSDTAWRNHTFHGYGASGNVTAPLVYANYGTPQDFSSLQQAGIDVVGKIVLVRYGKCFRGLKVRNAQIRGALGVVIYSDPQDDGYVVGPVYPAGPWRPESGVQRGSVQFNSKCAGDPMRVDARYQQSIQEICGVANYTDLIPSIPSIPISYGDALPLLQNMGGKKAFDVGGESFCGGLDIEYTVGPSTENVLRLIVDNHETIRTIPNVVGHIPGTLSRDKDMPVLLGNHRDAW